MSLSLSLLGGFQASLDGRPLTEFYSSKVRALLAYLAVEAGREHPRPVLAALLWPDWDDRAALGNLRFSLSKLRQAIDDQNATPPFLLISRESLQLNPTADVSLDVRLFQQELRASQWESVDIVGWIEPAVRSAVERLKTALDLYRGSFLEGFSVGDSAVFEEWALVQREQLEREARWALHGLTALSQRLGELAAAEGYARRLLDLNPWDEPGNRRLMAVLAQQGKRNAALRHYAAYQDEMARELGCGPEEETQALYVQIRDGELSGPWSRPQPALTLASAWSGPATVISGPPARFAAREHELARLGSLLDGALAGQGGMALIAGEAGSGKTALLDEFARQASQARGDLIVLRGSCNAHAGAGDPYLPFREMLQTLAGDVEGKRAGGTLSPEQVRRVRQALPAVGQALVEHGPDLLDRLVPGEALLRRIEEVSVPPGVAPWKADLRALVCRARESGTPVSDLGREPALQANLFGQITQVLHTVALGRPLLLAVDDLQWADGDTAALLFHLGRRLAGSRILLACAYRPQDLDDQDRDVGIWPVLQELTRLWGDVRVDLDEADGRAFIEAYVDSEPNCLGAAFRQALYDHTAGHALFTVELVRSFERAGMLVRDEAGQWLATPGLDWARCPPRVEAVIARHLAGLPDGDRALLQAASVQGERFDAEVVARVLGQGEETVIRQLGGPLQARHRLVEAVSLERIAASGQRPSASSGQRPSTSSGQRLSRYRFRHSLVQGIAYRSLDAVARARLHEATGRAMEAIYAAAGKQSAPELARHFEAAGLPLEATHYRLEAGRQAMRLAAYDEAISHLERGLALLEGVATSPERLHLELGLCLSLVNPVVLQQGFQASSLKRALARLFELAQHRQLQDDPQHLTALVLLALASSWSADPERGRQVGEQLLELAPFAGAEQAQSSDQQLLMLAHWVLGHSHWLQGQLAAAREHLGQALALYDPAASRSLGLLFPGEPGVTGHALLSFVLWLLGYPDQGRSSLQQALVHTHEIEQLSTRAFTHAMAGVINVFLGRDGAEALKQTQALRALGKAGQIYGAWGEMLTGQAGAAGPGSGLEQGLALVAEAGSASMIVDASVGRELQLSVQAQVAVQAGQFQKGLDAMDQALAWIERTGVRTIEAEMWRMRGEVLLAPDGPDKSRIDEAEACFQRALAVARAQKARWWELRAAVSLARLWQELGRRDDARKLLDSVYRWFTEGFDTPDLVEAQVLLAELG